MAKLLRSARTGNSETGHLVRYGGILGGILCLVGLLFNLVHTLLPLLKVLVLTLAVWWFWQRYRKVQNRQQKHLHTTFYRLLQEHHGRMTLLDFAMTAQISAIDARSYLDSRAQEFAARFEVSDHGDVVYVFSTLQFSRLEPMLPSNAVTAVDGTARPSLPASLTQAELAKRLGVTAKTVSRKKRLPTLSDWTQTRDPNGIGWFYDAQAQRFLPLSDRPAKQTETECS